MPSSTETQERRTRRVSNSSSRGHVRPARKREGAPEDLKQIPQRMRPRSQVQAEGEMSLAERRAYRRARKARTQAQARGERRSRPVQLLSWRLVSAAMVVGLSAVLYMFLTMPAFRITSIQVGGERYLEAGEVFRLSEIAQQRVFWVDPEAIEARLEDVPNIADAEVLIGWPPDMVQIIVREREPALIWHQDVAVWVDVNGIVMRLREDREDLLVIRAEGYEQPISAGAQIPRSVVEGAQLLQNRYPDITELVYDSEKGLGHNHTMGWTVWFGDGSDMDTKLLVYNQLVEDIVDEMQPGEIDLRNPDHPVVEVLWYIE